jgi:hypothetical protein
MAFSTAWRFLYETILTKSNVRKSEPDHILWWSLNGFIKHYSFRYGIFQASYTFSHSSRQKISSCWPSFSTPSSRVQLKKPSPSLPLTPTTIALIIGRILLYFVLGNQTDHITNQLPHLIPDHQLPVSLGNFLIGTKPEMSVSVDQ